MNHGAINFGPFGPSLRVIDVLDVVREFISGNLDHIQLSNEKSFYEASTLALDSSLSRTTLNYSPKFTQRESILMTLNWWKKLNEGDSIRSACNEDINEVIRRLNEK